MKMFTRKTRTLPAWLAVALLVVAQPVFSAGPVEVVGLFKNQAVIRVAGGDRLMKVGDVSPEGVRLISADANEAVVEYLGARHTLSLSSRVAGSFAVAEKPRISIPSDELGQYRIRGAINNHYVNFLVDTGASVVALSSAAANGIGIDYRNAKKGSVNTAQGTVSSHFLILDTVTVAGITAHNVQAAIIDGQYPLEILLGMSFLRQVAIEENGGVMTLTQKF